MSEEEKIGKRKATAMPGKYKKTRSYKRNELF
jgi:hypothetical protein